MKKLKINPFLLIPLFFLNCSVSLAQDDFFERMQFESQYNVPHRAGDGEAVLPPSERGLAYKFYEFYVPSELVTTIEGTAIPTATVRLEIADNHPLFPKLNKKFKMQEIGTSYRVLSRKTLLANTQTPHYHKPRMNTEELRRGIVLSKYVQKVLASSPQKNIAILDDYEGYILKIEDMTFSYVNRRYLPQGFTLKKNQKLIPLTALFGAEKPNSFENIKTWAQKLSEKANMPYSDWILQEYVPKFGTMMGEFMAQLGIMPLEHMQNTAAIIDEEKGKIVKFVSRDLGDSLVFPGIIESLSKSSNSHLGDLTKTNHHIFSNYQAESTVVSRPGEYFQGYVMQSLLFVTKAIYQSKEDYDLNIKSLGVFMDNYLKQLFKGLALNKKSLHWQNTFELIEALKNGFDSTTQYYRNKENSVRAPGLEHISSMIINEVFNNVHQEIISRFQENVNFDWHHQEWLKEKWLRLYQKMPINYFNSSAKRNVENLPNEKYSSGNTFYENEKGFYLFHVDNSINRTTPIAMISYSNHHGFSCLRFYN